MKTKMRTSILNRLTGFLMALAMVLGPVLGMGPAAFAETTANAVLDYSNVNCATVKVTNDEELRNALTSEENKLIVVQNDITVESQVIESGSRVERVEPFAEIPQIVVNGNKILDLNGHEIYYSDKSQLEYSYTYGGFGNEMVKLEYSSEMDPYNKTLILVGSGAELTVMDGEGNDGVLQFDSMFSEIDDAPYNVVRNVIEVKDGGKLNVHGGNIIAGRNKQIYSYVSDRAKGFMRTRVVTAYTMGSAVIVDGGDVTITGGVMKGRGKNIHYVEVGGILYKEGSLRIEDGKVFGYGRAPAICVINEEAENDANFEKQLESADIRIKGGYFESYCETYAAYCASLGYSMAEPSYHAFAVYNRRSEINVDYLYKVFLEDFDHTDVQHSTDCSGTDTAGDWGKECYTFTPKNKALNETLLNSEGSTGAVSIYQHQALDVILDYWDQAYWKAQNQFYGTDLMQSYFGVVADAEKNEAYLREHGMTAYFIVSRKVGDQYRAFLSFPVVKGMNEQFPLSIRLKAGSEKWETGEYKVVCEITERAGDKSVKNNCNVLTVNVVNSSEMLAFEDVQPQEYASNLGNVSVDTNVKLQFNAKANAELDPHLTLAKSVLVRKPGSYQYVAAAYDPVTGVYTIPVDQVGYYSVMEIVQLKNGETLLAQKSRELHFAGVDYTKTATVLENPNGTILLADYYGKVKNQFKPNDTVYVQATANQSNYRVKNIIVTNSKGETVTVQNGSFVMPDDDVTVTVAFERFYTLIYKQSADGPAVYTDQFTEDGVALRGAAFTKTGYKQTGWKIGGTVYPVGTVYTEKSNSTALPVFEPVKYSTVKYLFWSDSVNGYRFYEHAANYDYSKDPYYMILREDAFPAVPDYLQSQHILYFELNKDYESEIEGVTYHSGDRFYPGQSIIPMGEGLELYAVMQEKTLINPIELTFGDGNRLQIGTNEFLPFSNTSDCAVMQVELENGGGSALTEMVIPADSETKFIVYINADENFIFPANPENVTIRFAEDSFGTLSFTKEPKIEVITTGIYPSYKSMRVEITFYASCGNDESDHEFATHWCLNDEQYSYQFCEDCGMMRRIALAAVPEGLKPEEIHRMTLVSEVAGDCANGEYSVDQHYACADCGKCFSHSYGGDYVERDLTYFMFLHNWVDTHGNIDFYGNPIPAHFTMCADCHTIDESTIGFHHDDNHDQTCDECSYAMPCDHHWTYVEVPSTCAKQGTMTRTCPVCGEMETIIYNFADHTLVYVEETASTCSEHGKAGHYKCTDCGTLFDEDIYVHIKAIDPNGVRLENLAEKYPGSEFDHDGFYASDPSYKADYDLQGAVHQYALDHLISQPAFLPLDDNVHVNTELRNAVAVTVNADGYSGDLYCLDCNKLIEAGHTVEKHAHHAAAGEWSFNETGHYHVCDAYDGCSEHLDEAAHTFGPWTGVALADKVGEQWHECTACGYIEVLEYVPVPETVNGEKAYTVKDGLEDLASEEGKDVRYIFDLASANDASVAFEVNGMTVTFDKNAVKDIAGHDVKFKLSTSTENLGSFGIANAQMVLELSLGGVPFAGGKATVVVPVAFEVAEGSEVKVYYVNGGTKEDMNATFANNEVTFGTTHFSTFVIAYESTGAPVAPVDPEPTAPENPTPTEPAGKKGGLRAGAIIGIIIGVLAVVGLVIFLVLFLLKKKKEEEPEEAPAADAQEPVEAEAKPEKEGVTFGEKKTLNEEYALLSKDERKLFDRIKAHAITLEGVKTTEAQDYYTVSFKKEKIVRFRIRKGEIVAEFFANDKEFKELAGANAKETASSAMKVRTEEDADKVIEAIDYKHKSLTEQE